MPNPQDQAALTMAALSAAKPVGERQPDAGWVGGPGRDDSSCARAPAGFASQDCAATADIGCPRRQVRVSLTININ